MAFTLISIAGSIWYGTKENALRRMGKEKGSATHPIRKDERRIPVATAADRWMQALKGQQAEWRRNTQAWRERERERNDHPNEATLSARRAS